MGFSDERLMVSLKSPDGKLDLRTGDVSVPSCTVPSTYHYREGEIYDLGAQAQMVVEPYRTGPEYAVLYSESRSARVCKTPQQNPLNVDFTMPGYLSEDWDRRRPPQVRLNGFARAMRALALL